ncbi:MAG TPA: class I SAM-dependent methyltransferase, partial [Candidatus Omnitrophica bacterium]|nr:class I SAM-dependent methyltransferase [Candidatus Omnitrophota bacterium]
MTQLEKVNLHQEKEIELHRRLVKHYRYRYGFEFSKLFQRYWNKQIIRMVPTETNIKVLDLGCGSGLLLSELSDKYNFVVGLDLSNEMLKDIKNGFSSIKGLVNA